MKVFEEKALKDVTAMILKPSLTTIELYKKYAF